MKICPNCKKEFEPSSRHKLCSSCRNILGKKRCPTCGKMIQKRSSSCITCQNKSRVTEGGKKIYHQGYVLVKDKNHPRAKKHPYIAEHILVMEKRLGRYLLPNENVHHKNGIKDDNRDENLELWTRNQPSGARVKDLITWAKEIIDLYGNDESTF